MTVKTAVVIQHVKFEDMGTFAAPLEQRGYRVSYLQAGVDGLEPAAGADLLAILGGPIAVYEQGRYPFLATELEMLRARLDKSQPTLGICLGAQLMAAALDARVYPGPVKEIGWEPLRLTGDGKASPLAALDGSHSSMFHWHGDTFDLPQEATLLASTSHCKNQIFSLGRHGLAFQCHPELDAAHLEQWLIGHACELAGAGADLELLRRDTRQHGPVLAVQGRRAFSAWLEQCGA